MKLNLWLTILVIALLLLFVGAVLSTHNWDPNAFVMEGTLYGRGDPNGTIGYDGQFVYYIASDPFGAVSKIDDPAYRYQRILYPILAWILSLGGNQNMLPWVMLLINLLAASGSFILLSEYLSIKGLHAWRAVAFLFSAGMMISLRADLNEPLAILLALAGLVLIYHKKWVFAGLAFALGILAKEIVVVFVIGTVVWLLFEKKTRTALLLTVLSLLPAVLWGLFLTSWLGQSPLSADQAAMEILPFYGLLFIGVSPAKIMIILWVALPAILFGLVGSLDFLKRQHSLELFIVLMNVGLLAFMPRMTWYNFAGALRAVLGLCAISLVYTTVRWPRLGHWLGVYWMSSGLILLYPLIFVP